jgi:hypothetical protein
MNTYLFCIEFTCGFEEVWASGYSEASALDGLLHSLSDADRDSVVSIECIEQHNPLAYN